jgi:hypothetical protein
MALPIPSGPTLMVPVADLSVLEIEILESSCEYQGLLYHHSETLTGHSPLHHHP